MSHLCIAIRWLDDRYHGKDADGEPEWPPSPLRLFQALLASAYRRYGETDLFLPAFRWLQDNLLRPPIIVAPRAQIGRPFIRFVPNNDSDNQLERQKRLTAKPVKPTLFIGSSEIHYLWKLPEPLSDDVHCYADELCEIARSVVSFGWGVDMAIGYGVIADDEEVDSLRGERWLPHNDTRGIRRRVPCPTTLDALIQRHKLFVRRIRRDLKMEDADGLRTNYLSDLPPLDEHSFRVVGYRRATERAEYPVAAFCILKTDTSEFRSFDTARQALTVAGMLRHATRSAAEHSGWPKESIDTCILGHGEKRGAAHVTVGLKRFAYLPLPTIAFRGTEKAAVVGSIRRAIMTAFTEGCENEIAWARRALSGQELIPEGKKQVMDSTAHGLEACVGEVIGQNQKQAIALLSLIHEDDAVVRCYTQAAAVWATVTPVVLPGYDDPNHYRRRMKSKICAEDQTNLLNRLYGRIDGLLRKSIVQAGFSGVMADCAEIEWRKVGFWPGTELADRYGVPDHLRRFPRFHVRIQWRDMYNKPVAIPGPICLGGGRFYGLGLFATC